MKITNFFSAEKFSKTVLVLMLFLNAGTILGQKNIYKASRLLHHNELMSNGLDFTFIDPELTVPNHISISTKAFLRLKADSNIAPFAWSKTMLELRVMPILPDGGMDDGYPIKLEVEYNPLTNSSNFIDLSSHEIINRSGVRIRIESFYTLDVVSGSHSAILNPNITLEMGFESERYYQLTEQLPNLQHVFMHDEEGSPQALQFNWVPLVGALEYELEWTWVDNYSTTDSPLPTSQIRFSSRDFELNNTRIRTKNNVYEIPLIYSGGYIIYRVRAIGRFMDDVTKNYYGPWAPYGAGETNKITVADWKNCAIEIKEHDNAKNWQFQASFAEGGKKKEVVSYFDGSLRNRQTVTKINSDDNAIVGEVIYDTQGRAAIEVLPVPVRSRYIRYFKDLNRNLSNKVYTHLDFDWDSGDNTPNCNVALEGMFKETGASQYYSENNNIESSFRDFIPNAFDFPFSQIEYTPDNTGRISRKGGVGKTHQLGNNREMKYFYSVPNQEELNRLFGYHVGFASHYKKNIVVDPNGQVSVSYLDPQGKTVATALAGDAPFSMKPLGDEQNATIHKKFKVDLLNKINQADPDTPLDNNELGSTHNFANYNDLLSLSREIGVAGNNVKHNFEYNISNLNTFIPTNCNVEYPYVYLLNIRLQDACGINVADPINRRVSSGSSVITPTSLQPRDLSLSTGAYSLLKELKVDQARLNSYADDYVKRLKEVGSPCYIDPSTFGPDINIDCNTTCSECTQSIGTEFQYVSLQLNKVYNVPESQIFFTINPTTFAVSIVQPGQGSTVNFGQPIAQTEVNGFVYRFRNDWTVLNEACKTLCGITFSSSCSVNERSLLQDVSLDGQYGLLKGESLTWDILSLYNENNKIIYQGHVNDNATYKYNWRNPLTPYLDEEGNLSLIEVLRQENGSYLPPILPGQLYVSPNPDGREYVLPQHLANVEDFIASHNDSWDKSLLPYHPEYCYLEYSRKLCEIKEEIVVKQYGGANNDVIIASDSRKLTSDEYDDYLDYLDTYEKAAEYFNIQDADFLGIFLKDPYFKNQINGVENSSIYSWRKRIMEEALQIQYEEMTVNSDGTGVAARIYEMALKIVKCNAVEACYYDSINDIDNLTVSEKNRFWNAYKSLYLSLKDKIKHVFINVYAISQGCQNFCIGEGGSQQVTNVILNYNNYNQLTNINNYINQFGQASSPVSFCVIPEAINYKEKEKRFVPIDFAYDSGIDLTSAINQMATQGGYQYYLQTGNCPLVNDLDLFLKGYFEDINITTEFTSFANWNRFSQSLSKKLFDEFVGQSYVPTTSMATSVLPGGNRLKFMFGESSYDPSVEPLTLTLPPSSGLSWNNYSLVGNGKWHVIGFSQLFYDKENSDFTGSNPIFAFKVVAKIHTNTANGDANVREIILSGKTVARIGECHVNGDGDGIGEILDTDTADCGKKDKFAEGLKNLINYLRQIGQVNSSGYNLTGNTVFESNFLYSYFGIAPGTSVTWAYSNNTYRLNFGAGMGFSFGQGNLASYPINFLSLGGQLYNGISHAMTYSQNTPQGIKTYVVSIKGHSAYGGSQALYFACCSPCGDWDFNVNGIGDICDENNENPGEEENIAACPGNVSEEEAYENGLKELLNNYLQNHISLPGVIFIGNYPVSSNQTANAFVNSADLQDNFQSLRTSLHPLDPSYNLPVDLTYYNISSSAAETYISFNDGLANSVNTSNIILSFNFLNVIHIESVDVINSEEISIKYQGNSGVATATFPFINLTTYSILNGHANRSSLFCPFIAESNPPATNASRNRQGADIMIVYKEGKMEFIRESVFSKNRIALQKEPASACPCIPQTVEPVACDEKYQKLMTFLNFNSQGYSQRIQHLHQDSFKKEEFCPLNAQYLVDSYIDYITILGINSIENPNYLSIIQFGHTNLNYGYKRIWEVINQYNAYNPNPQNNSELMLWREFVNLIYMANADCPPAPLPTFSIPITLLNPCEELVANISATYQLDSYNEYIAYLRREFIRTYIEKAMSTVVEKFSMEYDDKEYQYTLYYYDQAGNLIQTVAPEGVKRFESAQLAALNPVINSHRKNYSSAENLALVPPHNFKTEYKYNSLNQLVYQVTPDGGATRFAYDALGRIIASQNANQKKESDKNGTWVCSYTTYDYLGRIVEAGGISTKPEYAISDDGRLFKSTQSMNEFIANDIIAKYEVTKTVYDEDPVVESNPEVRASSLFFTNNQSGFNPSHNNRNRVTGIFYYENLMSSEFGIQFTNAIFYNYDVHGNVKEVVNYNTGLKNLGCRQAIINNETNQRNDCEKHLKRIVYNYDLISGNVNTVTLQPEKLDQFIHKYNYDADNRITSVETSSDGVLWQKDADYKYYPHGPLARVELGDKKVQGVDYAYTLQGWLKVVNGESLEKPSYDLGVDGYENNRTQDAFGYSLSYYDKDPDYIAISDPQGDSNFLPLSYSRNASIGHGSDNLYNGNIKQMVTAIRKSGEELLPVQKNSYKYDQLNRILSMNSVAINNGGSFSDSYSSEYSYDRNGNLKTLFRSAPKEDGSIVKMDGLRYDYLPGNNKLTVVQDEYGGVFENDLKNQIEQLSALGINYNINDLNTHNYVYDAIGQLIEDKTEKLTIAWRIDGKVKSVRKIFANVGQLNYHTNIVFEYDGLGNRISKQTSSERSGTIPTSYNTTYYTRDAQGNVLGVYNLINNSGRARGINYSLKEHHLFGSSRLGLEEKSLSLYLDNNTLIDINKNSRSNNTEVVSGANEITSVQNFIPVFKDYSLSLSATANANWPMKLSSETLKGNLTNVDMATRFKFQQPAIADGEYGIGLLRYKAIEQEASVPPVFLNLSAYPCFVAELIEETFNFNVKRNNVSGCTGSITAEANVLAAGQDGFFEYKLGSAAQNNGLKVTFRTGGANALYGFRTSHSVNTISLFRVVNGANVSAGTFSSANANVLKVKREGSQIKYYVNNVEIATENVVSGTPSILNINLSTTQNQVRELGIFKIDNIAMEITNQMQLSVQKNASGYTPKISVTQYSKNTNTNIVEKRVFSANATTPISGVEAANGIELDLKAGFNTSAGNSFVVNGITQSLGNVQLVYAGTVPATEIPAVDENGNNRLGGSFNGLQPAGFDMCYFNYGFNSNLEGGVAHSFGFDDVTSDVITNNPPKASENSNIMMAVTPQTLRKLGPCLFDTDGDGLYDIYESINGNLAIDTDGDGIYNYMDPDDDGDGVLTKHEGADPDGDHNPFTGTAPLNTNATANGNPNIRTNTIPNYLDNDDDGDGYITAEEGANPDGTGRDTDGNGIPDYLDANDRIFEEKKEISFKDYLNLTGDKRYELSNHLGNVLVVVSDKKIPLDLGSDKVFNADVLSYNDYYPFGMLVPNRHGNSGIYRYGFNGKEKDDEIMGEGNSIDYGFRMHDPRVARFMSVDPLTKKFPELTPYQFASNTPIWAIDLDGMEAYFSNEGVFQKWGKDKSKTAQVIVDNKAMSLNVSEMLNRAHWVYGEGGGTMTNQLANALNNRAKLLGENEMYKGMTTWGKERKVDPEEQKEIYFLQTKTNSHEQVNSNYKDFNRLIRNGDENIDFTPNAELPTDVFKIGEMDKAIASTIQSLSGNLKDDLDGAAFWASGGSAKTYTLGQSAKGSTVTKVSQTTAYGVNATHYFYTAKKSYNSPSNKDCTTCIEEIKLEKPKLTTKKKS